MTSCRQSCWHMQNSCEVNAMIPDNLIGQLFILRTVQRKRSTLTRNADAGGELADMIGQLLATIYDLQFQLKQHQHETVQQKREVRRGK